MLCWVVGAFLAWSAYNVWKDPPVSHLDPDASTVLIITNITITVIVAGLITPLALLALTWRWVSGRNRVAPTLRLRK
jgi:hypothetical protein